MAKNIITREFLDRVGVGFQALFTERLGTGNWQWNKVAMEAPSDGSEEEYGWLGEVPMVREWVGERQIGQLRAHSYTIKNKKYEASTAVYREELEDDKLGLINPRVADLADSSMRHYEKLTFGLLSLGFTTACYDGQFFYSATHRDVAGAAAQSNVTNAVLGVNSFNAAFAAMQNFRDPNGEPLGITPNLLVVPPALRTTALDIVGRELADGGAGNVNNRLVDVIVSPWLTTATEWHLLDTTRAIKPVILQVRTAPEFVAQDDPAGESAFMRDEFRYGVRMRDNVGFSLWQLAYGSTGA